MFETMFEFYNAISPISNTVRCKFITFPIVVMGLEDSRLWLVMVRARVFRFSLGKVREIKKIKISKQNNKKFFFCLNQTLRTNYGILMSKNVCFRLNRVRGIRICNRIFKIPSSFCAIAI